MSNKLKIRPNIESKIINVSPGNTIPIIGLKRYNINIYGYVIDFESEQVVPSYLDYNHHTIIVQLTYTDDHQAWFSINDLLVLAYYGKIKLPLGNFYEWNDPFINDIAFPILKYLKRIDDNKIEIGNVIFKKCNIHDFYASRDGIIFNEKTLKIKRQSERNPKAVAWGYRVVNDRLLNGAMSVHRLVYLAWGGPIPEGYEVNHKDHNRWRNIITNLEAISKRENLKDAAKFNNNSYITDDEYIQIYSELDNHTKTADIAKKYNLDLMFVRAIKAGRSKPTDISIYKKYAHTEDYQKDCYSTGMTQELADQICQDIISGMQNREIAKKYDMPESIIGTLKSEEKYKSYTEKYRGQLKPVASIKGKVFTTDQVHEICKYLEQGYGPTEIANMYGVQEGTIMKIKSGSIWANISSQYDFSKWNSLKHCKALTGEKVKEICKLYMTGKWTSRDIGWMLGVNRATIDDILKRKTWVEASADFDLSSINSPMHLKCPSGEVINKICKDLLTDMSMKDIAYKYNISLSMLNQILCHEYRTDVSSQYSFENRTKRD